MATRKDLCDGVHRRPNCSVSKIFHCTVFVDERADMNRSDSRLPRQRDSFQAGCRPCGIALM